jgi:hypothetical protein
MSVATAFPAYQSLDAMDLTSINTIRTLAMDGVQAANSGHPGTPASGEARLHALAMTRVSSDANCFRSHIPSDDCHLGCQITCCRPISENHSPTLENPSRRN